MPYTPHSRDLFKSLSAVLTGVATFATVAVAGTASGLAARETALRDQARQQEQARLDVVARADALRARTAVTRQRPQRTVVRTRVLHVTSRGGVARVGPGGSVSSSYPTSVGLPPPAPAPAPVPTSGS